MSLPDLPFDPSHVLIGGVWRPAASGETLVLSNPSDETDLTRIARGGAEDIDAAVAAAQSAREGDWGRMPAFERGRVFGTAGATRIRTGWTGWPRWRHWTWASR